MPISVSREHWVHPTPGLVRDDPSHTYRIGSYSFAVSVTGVVGVLKSPVAMRRIEETRDEWAPRGTTVHRVLELAIDAARRDAPWHVDHFPPCWDYLDWAIPLLDHPFWDAVEVIGSETPVGSIDVGVAGTYDGGVRVKATGRRLLFDLKSQKRRDAGPYCTKAQLGGYLDLDATRGVHWDGAFTIWSRPGRTKIGPVFSVEECLEAWDRALEAYDRVSEALSRRAA